MTEPLTLGVHHIGLALPDIEAGREFFCEALGYQIVGGNPDYPAHFVSDGKSLITLWQLADPVSTTPFDRSCDVGLHHLAIGVADNAALDIIHARVRVWPGATIEFAPCPMREGSAVRQFMCTIPGGVRVEFATPFI